MLPLFGVLIILSSLILGLIVLIQNPKGGGLSSTFGGVGNQLMGVKQTTDVLEKGTWVFAAAVGILCLISPAFIPSSSEGGNNELLKGITTKTQQSAPANTVPVTETAPVGTPNP